MSHDQRDPHVYIMGLGWLGLALAQDIQSANINIAGSVRHNGKQSELLQQGLSADLFDLYQAAADPTDKLTANLSIHANIDKTTLVLNIPPGRNQFEPVRFANAIMTLIDELMHCGLKKLIFISTTSVFATSATAITNSTLPNPSTDSGNAHFIIEQHLLHNYAQRSVVLRLAGLVGPNQDGSLRHPIKSLMKRREIEKGNEVVNLVHQWDVITAIKHLLISDNHPFSMNLVSLEHPRRGEYYTWCAQQLNLPVPSFAPYQQKRQQGKLVDARQTYAILGFTPRYASPYDMLM